MHVRVTRRKKGGGLDELVDACEAPEPAMRAIGDVVSADIAERFATRTDPWGTPWAPVSPVTVEIKRKRGSQVVDLAATRAVEILDAGKRVVISLRSGIARLRHFGAPNNRIFGRAPAPIPARPELPIRGGRVDLPQGLRRKVLEAFREGFRRALRRG